MTSLFNLFVNNNNKPKQSFISNAVATQNKKEKEAELDKKRKSQQKAWRDALYGQDTLDTLGKTITDNATKMQEHEADGTLYTGPNSGSSNGGGGSSDYGSSGGGSSSGGSSDESESTFDKKAYKRALSSI